MGCIICINIMYNISYILHVQATCSSLTALLSEVTQYHTLRWTNMALGFVPSPYVRPGSMVFYYCAIASLVLITLLTGWPLVGKVREVSSPSNHHEKRDSFPEHPFFSGKFQRLRHHFNSIPPSSSVLGSKLVMLGMVIPPLMTGIQKNGYMKFETLLRW